MWYRLRCWVAYSTGSRCPVFQKAYSCTVPVRAQKKKSYECLQSANVYFFFFFPFLPFFPVAVMLAAANAAADTPSNSIHKFFKFFFASSSIAANTSAPSSPMKFSSKCSISSVWFIASPRASASSPSRSSCVLPTPQSFSRSVVKIWFLASDLAM